MISAIVPVLNEGATIERVLARFRREQGVEVIVVDGGSQDNTRELVGAMGFQVLRSPVAGRSQQMNLGARQARGNILLFLHGDTILPPNYAATIAEIMAHREIIAGAFALRVEAPQTIFRCLETMVNWRSLICSLPYGDQGIFLRKSTFEQLGGFAPLPIMEDFELVRRLQKLGKIAIAPEAVITSARRWQKLGVVKTTLINQLMIVGYYLGVNLDDLANFYRRAG